MMKQFLIELEHELRALEKEERNKCINDFEEIILDKVENGISEADAISSLGNVKQIAKDIINSYVELDGKRTGSQRYFNVAYLLLDTIILIIAYALSYVLCFSSGLLGKKDLHLSFNEYIVFLIFIIPCYLGLYYILKTYAIKYVDRCKMAVKRLFLCNIFGIIIIHLFLLLSNTLMFSREMLLLFGCINFVLQIMVRHHIFYYLSYFLEKNNKFTYFKL